MQTFQLAEPGFRIELVASDPMIQDPVAATFDGEGRLWVVEMRGYMQDVDRTGVNDPIGRVSVLEDLDQDGVMDRSTIFAKGLILPRAIAILPDGVLIAENKPLTYFEDVDGDLVADRKTVVDPDYARDSVEHSSNGLMRGLDNWFYNAKEGVRYKREGDQWIRQDTEARGQWGICQDNFGRLFYNYNHSQLHADLVPPNSLTRNPNHEPSTGLSVGVTQTNQVFPIRPTLAANRGYIPGALDENGRIQEFTSAGAPLIYRDHLFPSWAGNSFVCEPVGNLIKRSVITNLGIQLAATSAYPDRDFLASTDERFRPCWLTHGPDGALYIVDMYRGIVQDGPHMSPYLREHSIARQMDRPIHLGRIWRIVPEDFRQPKPPSFSAMNAAQLVETLAHPNGWWRDQSQMHLVDRNLTQAVPSLESMVVEHPNPLARLHAFWTLEGMGQLQNTVVFSALNSTSDALRTAALRVLPSLNLATEELAPLVAEFHRSPMTDPVALQWLLTMGDLPLEESVKFGHIREILTTRSYDPLFRDAALSSLPQQELAFLRHIWQELPGDSITPGDSMLVEMLAAAVVRSREPDDIKTLLAFLDMPDQDNRTTAVFQGFRSHGPALLASPISLLQPPGALSQYPELENFLAWPGHDPVASRPKHVRALTEKEQELFSRGRQVYLTTCVGCHANDGKGTPSLAPPLAGSDWVTGSEERLVRVLFHGLTGPVTVSGKTYTAPNVQPFMPPLANLNNEDIAAVLTYVRREWGNQADPISGAEVSQHRIRAQGRTTPWTQEELEPFASPEHRP